MQHELMRVRALLTEAVGLIEEVQETLPADPRARDVLLAAVGGLRLDLLGAVHDVCDAATLDDVYGVILCLDEVTNHLQDAPAAPVLATA